MKPQKTFSQEGASLKHLLKQLTPKKKFICYKNFF